MEFSETQDPYKDLRSSVSKAIEEKSSFELKNIENMAFALKLIKQIMREKGVRYRVSTSKRASRVAQLAGGGIAVGAASFALETAAIGGPMLIVSTAATAAAMTGVGAVALAGIGAYKLLKSFPDYEVVRYPSSKEIDLIYKK